MEYPYQGVSKDYWEEGQDYYLELAGKEYYKIFISFYIDNAGKEYNCYQFIPKELLR